MGRSIHCRRVFASDRLHLHAGLSETLKKLLATAAKVDAARYDEARATAAACRAMLGEVFADADVILAPSAPGEAPRGLRSPCATGWGGGSAWAPANG